jgi:hypothetical protein
MSKRWVGRSRQKTERHTDWRCTFACRSRRAVTKAGVVQPAMDPRRKLEVRSSAVRPIPDLVDQQMVHRLRRVRDPPDSRTSPRLLSSATATTIPSLWTSSPERVIQSAKTCLLSIGLGTDQSGAILVTCILRGGVAPSANERRRWIAHWG